MCIAGRLLVGLRWWNNVDEDGKSQWIFESRKVREKKIPIMQFYIISTINTAQCTISLWKYKVKVLTNKLLLNCNFQFSCFAFQNTSQNTLSNTESRIFWLALVISQILWVVFFFATIFTLKFKWFVSVTFYKLCLSHQWWSIQEFKKNRWKIMPIRWYCYCKLRCELDIVYDKAKVIFICWILIKVL